MKEKKKSPSSVGEQSKENSEVSQERNTTKDNPINDMKSRTVDENGIISLAGICWVSMNSFLYNDTQSTHDLENSSLSVTIEYDEEEAKQLRPTTG